MWTTPVVALLPCADPASRPCRCSGASGIRPYFPAILRATPCDFLVAPSAGHGPTPSHVFRPGTSSSSSAKALHLRRPDGVAWLGSLSEAGSPCGRSVVQTAVHACCGRLLATDRSRTGSQLRRQCAGPTGAVNTLPGSVSYFDPAKGLLSCAAGASIDDILRTFVPCG